MSTGPGGSGVTGPSLSRAVCFATEGLADREPVRLGPVPYPPRPQLRPLPEFAGTARTGTVPSRELQTRLEAFIVGQYAAGRSLREIAEMVDRTQTAVRRALDRHGVARRPAGAQALNADPQPGI